MKKNYIQPSVCQTQLIAGAQLLNVVSPVVPGNINNNGIGGSTVDPD